MTILRNFLHVSIQTEELDKSTKLLRLNFIDERTNIAIGIWYEGTSKSIFCKSNLKTYPKSYDISPIVDNITKFLQKGYLNSYDGSVYYILLCILSIAINEAIDVYISPNDLNDIGEIITWMNILIKEMCK